MALTQKSMHRILSLSAAVIAIAVVASQILSAMTVQYYELDYHTYRSIDALGASSDVVVVGKVEETVGRYEDRGGDPRSDEDGDAIPGIPMVVLRVVASDFFKATHEVPDSLPVASINLDEVIASGTTPLQPDSTLLLFLVRRTVESAPDIAPVADTLWVPLSGNYGVLDVTEGRAFPRAAELRRLTPDDPIQSSFSLEAVARAVG